jgi:hypothetical protein
MAGAMTDPGAVLGHVADSWLLGSCRHRTMAHSRRACCACWRPAAAPPRPWPARLAGARCVEREIAALHWPEAAVTARALVQVIDRLAAAGEHSRSFVVRKILREALADHADAHRHAAEHARDTLVGRVLVSDGERKAK